MLTEFFVLIGEIFLIVGIQTVLEWFIEQNEKTYFVKILNIACYAASLYLLLDFVFSNLVQEMFTLFKMTFG